MTNLYVRDSLLTDMTADEQTRLEARTPRAPTRSARCSLSLVRTCAGVSSAKSYSRGEALPNMPRWLAFQPVPDA